MKKALCFIPALLAVCFYGYLAITCGIGSLSPYVGIFATLLFAAGVLLAKNKWWGALFGLSVGIVLVWMGFQYTGQTINIEKPLGIAFCLFYLVCGAVSFKGGKTVKNSEKE